MKPTLKFKQVQTYLMHFLISMVWNKEMLYCHYFSTSLQNIQLGRSKKIRNWNWMEHISFLS